jgi:dipeptidyl aminopeptidase/acylaminoacyl peptidase
MSTDPFLDQILHLPSVEEARLSPDGKWIAFSWYRMHENIDIFLAPSDGSQPPLALTDTSEFTELVSWTGDSQAVIVAEDHDGDERVRLFRIDLNLDLQGAPHPGKMQPLTEDQPPYFLHGGELSPDGKTLYYAANYDFEKGQKQEATWIYRHELRSGYRQPIARPQRPVYIWMELNRAGTYVIYNRKDRHPAGNQIHLVDVNGKQDREILNFGDQAKVFAKWMPDSARILVVAELQDADGQPYKALGLYDCPSASLSWLVDNPQRNIDSARVSRDGLVIVDEIIQARHQTSYIDPQTSQEKAFPALRGNLLPLGRAANGKWLARFYSSVSPAELVFFDLEDSPDAHTELYSITHVWDRTALKPGQLCQAESVTWISYDGLEIQGWLYRSLPNPRRAVIMIHGGPTYHSEDELKPGVQYLVAQGFNVLDVNYRGSTGFGLPFQEAIKRDGWGGREQQDIAAGAQSLIRAGLAEPGRVGVYGTSYGGYSSWYQITHFPAELIAAAAPICGMTDLVVDYETTRPDLRPYSEEMMGGSPAQAPERYYQRSPINFVQDIQGKLLIIQGAQDPNVSPENVRQVVQTLEAHRIPYETLVFDDEGHGITRPKNQAVLLTRLAHFFNRSLGPISG